MAKGNFIVFKGPSQKGKTTVAYSTIKSFIQEDSEHRAIYIGLTHNSGQKLFKSLPEELHDRVMAIGVDPLSADKSTAANFLLAPIAALKASHQQGKLLIVFDDVLLHKFKEKHVYDLASQPFSPINIVNELMEQTGCFQDGRVVSSIVIVETEANQLQFQKDEDAALVHIESIADQIVEFSDDKHRRRLGTTLPILPSEPGQIMPNQSCFLRPFVRAMSSKFQTLTDQIDKAHVQHSGKELMKIVEDPWENFLYHDSKYVLPIMCHASDMTIEEQILVAMFLQKSVQDETISQYKLQGTKLIDALVKFVKEQHGLSSTDAVQQEEDDGDDEGDDIVDELLKIKNDKRGKTSNTLLDKLRECSVSKGNLGRPETN